MRAMIGRCTALALVLLVPFQVYGNNNVNKEKIDDVNYLVTVLDANRPTSGEGWTRDVTPSVCPHVTEHLYDRIRAEGDIPGITIRRAEIAGLVEIHISRLLSPIFKHTLVIAGNGSATCNATIYSDAH
jgi:hypothetical protein